MGTAKCQQYDTARLNKRQTIHLTENTKQEKNNTRKYWTEATKCGCMIEKRNIYYFTVCKISIFFPKIFGYIEV